MTSSGLVGGVLFIGVVGAILVLLFALLIRRYERRRWLDHEDRDVDDEDDGGAALRYVEGAVASAAVVLVLAAVVHTLTRAASSDPASGSRGASFAPLPAIEAVAAFEAAAAGNSSVPPEAAALRYVERRLAGNASTHSGQYWRAEQRGNAIAVASPAVWNGTARAVAIAVARGPRDAGMLLQAALSSTRRDENSTGLPIWLVLLPTLLPETSSSNTTSIAGTSVFREWLDGLVARRGAPIVIPATFLGDGTAAFFRYGRKAFSPPGGGGGGTSTPPDLLRSVGGPRSSLPANSGIDLLCGTTSTSTTTTTTTATGAWSLCWPPPATGLHDSPALAAAAITVVSPPLCRQWETTVPAALGNLVLCAFSSLVLLILAGAACHTRGSDGRRRKRWCAALSVAAAAALVAAIVIGVHKDNVGELQRWAESLPISLGHFVAGDGIMPSDTKEKATARVGARLQAALEQLVAAVEDGQGGGETGMARTNIPTVSDQPSPASTYLTSQSPVYSTVFLQNSLLVEERTAAQVWLLGIELPCAVALLLARASARSRADFAMLVGDLLIWLISFSGGGTLAAAIAHAAVVRWRPSIVWRASSALAIARILLYFFSALGGGAVSNSTLSLLIRLCRQICRSHCCQSSEEEDEDMWPHRSTVDLCGALRLLATSRTCCCRQSNHFEEAAVDPRSRDLWTRKDSTDRRLLVAEKAERGFWTAAVLFDVGLAVTGILAVPAPGVAAFAIGLPVAWYCWNMVVAKVVDLVRRRFSRCRVSCCCQRCDRCRGNEFEFEGGGDISTTTVITTWRWVYLAGVCYPLPLLLVSEEFSELAHFALFFGDGRSPLAGSGSEGSGDMDWLTAPAIVATLMPFLVAPLSPLWYRFAPSPARRGIGAIVLIMACVACAVLCAVLEPDAVALGEVRLSAGGPGCSSVRGIP